MNLQTLLKANNPVLFDIVKREASLLDISVSDYLLGALAKELAQSTDYGARNITKLDNLIKEAKNKAIDELKALSEARPEDTITVDDYTAHIENYNLWQKHFDWTSAMDNNLPPLTDNIP